MDLTTPSGPRSGADRLESLGSRSESRRSLLKKIGTAGALAWTVPLIMSAAPVQSLSPCAGGDPVCLGENPSTGHCVSDGECFPGNCNHSVCVPSSCYCACNGTWVCTNDCGGFCDI